MRIAPAAVSDFAEYRKAFTSLEQALRYAGNEVEFYCYIGDRGKMVEISEYNTLSILEEICIEGDSPVQALKDVFAAVRL
jgi:hypothetical protein